MFNKFTKILLAVFVGLFLFSPTFVFAGRTEGGEINSFDIQPRVVGGTTASRKVNVTFKVTVYQPELNNFCSTNDSISWKIVERLPASGDGVIAKGTKGVLASGVQNIDLSISQLQLPIRTTSPTRTLYGLIECGSVTGGNIAQSEDIIL